MRCFYILSGIMLLSAASASAQPTFRLGVRGGLNQATSSLADASNSPTSSPFTYSATKSAIYAWQAGAVLEIAYQHFALQPALVISQKGELLHTFTATSGVAGQSTSETQTTNRPNWLEMPVNVVYTLHGIQAFAGPYVALAVGGQERSTVLQSSPNVRFGPYEVAEKIRYGSDAENRRLDAGINFGLGYRSGPLQVQLSYGLGLRNLHEPFSAYIISENPYYHDFNADHAYNRVAQLTGTYFFKL
jgi:hypothetical protein